MKQLSKGLVAILVALTAGLAVGQAKEIRIAHVYGKTGPLEAYAKQTQVGLMMGLEYATGGKMEVLGRKIVVVGACTGSDAHTVGIDAILNMKGYAGEKGLEAYKSFEAYNLGAQVENDQLLERAQALSADSILVSQVITQRNCHKENGRALIELLEKRP